MWALVHNDLVKSAEEMSGVEAKCGTTRPQSKRSINQGFRAGGKKTEF